MFRLNNGEGGLNTKFSFSERSTFFDTIPEDGVSSQIHGDVSNETNRIQGLPMVYLTEF